MTEFKSDGTPIFHTYMDTGLMGDKVENYRGFRYNWTGIPNEAPAIIALEDGDKTGVYVSWNGDTRTKLWRFFEIKDGRKSFIGESQRKSFETELTVHRGGVSNIQAEAFDAEGELLVKTSTIEPEALIHEFRGPKKGKKNGLVPWLTFKGQKFFKSHF